jgi:hypothetical protein
MQCLGITKKRKRCLNPGKRKWWPFCHHHLWQPISLLITIFLVIGYFAGLYQDLINPIIKVFRNDKEYIYVFPKLDLELAKINLKTTFPNQDIETIKESMKTPLSGGSRCPCGSGKIYSECHSATKDISDENIWKGPGFKQNIYLGFREPINGIEYQHKDRGEIKLIKNKDRISLCKYYTMDYSILSNKVIIHSLNVSENNNKLIFSGQLVVEGNDDSPVQLLVGNNHVDTSSKFNATIEGITVPYERGRWIGYIGEPANPMRNILHKEWYRYFVSRGFLLLIKPNKQLVFKLETKIDQTNMFTITLPFGSIEFAPPKVVTNSIFSNVIFEIEREQISWDLVLHSELFNEKYKQQADSIFVDGVLKNKELDEAYEGFRKLMEGPIKMRIGLDRENEKQ